MTKDEYFKQLEDCQKMYDAAWKSHTGGSVEDFYQGQSADQSTIPYGL